MATAYPIRIRPGVTLRLRCALARGGAPIDLTGHVIRWQVHESAASSAPYLDASSDDSSGQVSITDPAGGEFELYLPPDTTSTLPWDRAVYALTDADPSGDVGWLFGGRVEVLRA